MSAKVGSFSASGAGADPEAGFCPLSTSAVSNNKIMITTFSTFDTINNRLITSQCTRGWKYNLISMVICLGKICCTLASILQLYNSVSNL